MPYGVLAYLRSSEIARFWAKVDIRGEGECWNWKACVSGGSRFDWYGVFFRGRREAREDGTVCKYYAHRLSFILARGWPVQYLVPEIAVMHTCDNHYCCNPAHLSLGTQRMNVLDMIRKGRYRGRYGRRPTTIEEIPV